MKSKHAPASFLVPRTIGRSEGDMVGQGKYEQLELFREVLTRRAKVQFIAMMALSNPKHLDQSQFANVADILRAMGYEPEIRKDGKTAFAPWMYETVEDTGLKLRNPTNIIVRETTGYDKLKRPKRKTSIVNLSLLQEFGFSYEDEKGEPIDLKTIPQTELIKYDEIKGKALYAIPMEDEKGNVVKNKDGTPRRRMANGVTWTFSSRIARLTEERDNNWIIYKDSIPILLRYLDKKSITFDLIWKTLFIGTKTGYIEFGHKQLIKHLRIMSKDNHQVEESIKEAFANMLKEGIIDKPVIIKPAGYYNPTQKTGRSRRTDQVYQWKCAAKWQPARNLISVDDGGIEANSEEKMEGRKDGNHAKGL